MSHFSVCVYPPSLAYSHYISCRPEFQHQICPTIRCLFNISNIKKFEFLPIDNNINMIYLSFYNHLHSQTLRLKIVFFIFFLPFLIFHLYCHGNFPLTFEILCSWLYYCFSLSSDYELLWQFLKKSFSHLLLMLLLLLFLLSE